MHLRADLAPEVRKLASEAFNRCWHFIEQDPVLAGADRPGMQDQLAQLISQLMRDGERNLIVIANRAICTLRQEYATQGVA
jgi:hypothetical protein